MLVYQRVRWFKMIQAGDDICDDISDDICDHVDVSVASSKIFHVGGGDCGAHPQVRWQCRKWTIMQSSLPPKFVLSFGATWYRSPNALRFSTVRQHDASHCFDRRAALALRMPFYLPVSLAIHCMDFGNINVQKDWHRSSGYCGYCGIMVFEYHLFLGQRYWIFLRLVTHSGFVNRCCSDGQLVPPWDFQFWHLHEVLFLFPDAASMSAINQKGIGYSSL